MKIARDAFPVFFFSWLLVCIPLSAFQSSGLIKLNKPQPNPFVTETVVSYELKEKCAIDYVVSDRIGEYVVQRFLGSQSAGLHEIVFNARDLPCGPYLFDIAVTPSTGKEKRKPSGMVEFLLARAKKNPTYSKEEQTKFNLAFMNIFDDPPRGIRLMQELMESYPDTILGPSVQQMLLEGYFSLFQAQKNRPPSNSVISIDEKFLLQACRELLGAAPTANNYHVLARHLLECAIELPLALEYAGRALDLNQKGPFYDSSALRVNFLWTKAKILIELNAPEKAAEALVEALAKNKEVQAGPYLSAGAEYLRPRLILDLGRAYERLRAFDKALRALEDAAVLMPANADLVESLKRVYTANCGSLAGFDDYYNGLNAKVLSLNPGSVFQPVHRKALPFELAALEGKRVKLDDFRGKVVVLNFWGYWCGACKAEMPLLQRLWEEYRDKDIIVLTVHFDPGIYSREENMEKIQNFVKKAKLTFPILLHEGNLAAQYGGTALPTTFLIDQDGFVRYECFGYDADSDFGLKIREKIESLIRH